jgi:hypothetical protein
MNSVHVDPDHKAWLKKFFRNMAFITSSKYIPPHNDLKNAALFCAVADNIQCNSTFLEAGKFLNTISDLFMLQSEYIYLVFTSTTVTIAVLFLLKVCTQPNYFVTLSCQSLRCD